MYYIIKHLFILYRFELYFNFFRSVHTGISDLLPCQCPKV
eukprot:UN16310